EEARRLATTTGDVVLPLRAVVDQSGALVAPGRLDQAATVALDGLDQARRHGLVHFNGPLLATNAAQALVALGRWDQAEQVTREVLETAPSDVASAGLPLIRATLELARGDFDRARSRLQAVQRQFPALSPEAQKAGPLFASRAELALWHGDLDQAKRLVAQAIPLVEANPRYAVP